MKSIKRAPLAVALVMSVSALSAASAFAQVSVGGAPMYASKDIIDIAVNSKDHTALVAAAAR
jgi:hypothetical protein